MSATPVLFMKISYLESFYEDFIEISKYPSQIGRDPGSQIALMGQDVSRKHAEIIESDGKIFIKDLGSRSGIWKEGKIIHETQILEGTQVRLGAAILTFSFVQFPMEQTASHDHFEERSHHHEPFMKRLEVMFEGKLAFILFFILLCMSYLTAPDFYRKSDYLKNLVSSLFSASFVVPFILSLAIVTIRKINRGDYSWNRSLCMSLLLCISGQLVALLEKSFCWFKTFEFAWNSMVIDILAMSVFFFWWFLSVGKNVRFQNRALRSLILASITYALIAGVQLLATGYNSEFNLESCDSLTGWHWGEGQQLSSLEEFVDKSAKELNK
jgi:hypothetical protein